MASSLHWVAALGSMGNVRPRDVLATMEDAGLTVRALSERTGISTPSV